MHKYAYIHTQTSIVVHKAFKCQRQHRTTIIKVDFDLQDV